MTKVAIVGGAGRVGKNFAFDLLIRDLVHHIALIDIDEELAAGEALDLTHATAACGNCKVTSGGPEEYEDADIVVIPAGSRRKADESRLDLIQRNVGILDNIIDDVTARNQDCLIFIVVNPVDVLTRRALEYSGFDRTRVFGLGNVLDAQRFASLLAKRFGWNPAKVDTLILGEHGDNMVPIFSQLAYNGVRFDEIQGLSEEQVRDVMEETRGSGAEVIRMKGGAGWSVGSAISSVIRAIVRDTKEVLPISTDPAGTYPGLEDIGGLCLSLPTVVGANGVEGYFGVELSEQEREDLRHAAEVLEETYGEIEGAGGAAASKPAK